ncbi:coatomer subunit beta [Thecamonas trahens ATCC 50062]|uniref:Coatomer subunit beta n=1 Tax=Thecamonas trahens ATCC 50062 TaxID=461836 RepID=A0A0L0DVE2_THETB|nr:coatomer subunit beta [Thecamonas trahens ATCC 50062]KNC56132.1 coatomer subunit beta [Thecamonas trahens ATCC 50062]|eukprot:XP_013761171.1 coatomer subunit beta [Thecamonas trahens ATCC 50062]
MTEVPCTLLLSTARGAPATQNEIRKKLENSDDLVKLEGMKELIESMLAGGEKMDLLMTVIRFVLPTRDKALKKLLLYYFEMVPKNEPDGSLKREFILVCNAWMQDLNHPNEYVRGSTLRFLCRIKEADLLETLVPSVKTCLTHRHTYVKRNAVMALMSIYMTSADLVPDAAELLEEVLAANNDEGVQRNAFVALYSCDEARAIKYLAEHLETVSSFNDSMQLGVIELIRKVYRSSPSERSRYIRVVGTLLDSTSPSVRFEAAITLILLSSAATAVRAAATTFVDLIVNQADNNVKLIVLDRLATLKAKYTRVLQDVLMDILRALASPNLDIRKKTLDICMDLVAPRNISQVIAVLKKEVARTQAESDEAKAEQYRRILIQSIHSIAVNFPDVAADVVDLLMDFVSDASASASDVVVFVREVVHTNPHLRKPVLHKLMAMFGSIHSSEVMRGALWIIGEYAETGEDVSEAFKSIRSTLGDIPFLTDDEDEADDEGAAATEGSASAPPPKASSAPRLNADGTYATQSAYSESRHGDVEATAATSSLYPLRDLLFKGDFSWVPSWPPRSPSSSSRHWTSSRTRSGPTPLRRRSCSFSTRFSGWARRGGPARGCPAVGRSTRMRMRGSRSAFGSLPTPRLFSASSSSSCRARRLRRCWRPRRAAQLPRRRPSARSLTSTSTTSSRSRSSGPRAPATSSLRTTSRSTSTGRPASPSQPRTRSCSSTRSSSSPGSRTRSMPRLTSRSTSTTLPWRCSLSTRRPTRCRT